jgi:bifunctional non-homologous end joining protein LigD
VPRTGTALRVRACNREAGAILTLSVTVGRSRRARGHTIGLLGGLPEPWSAGHDRDVTLPVVVPMLASTGQPTGDLSGWSWEVKWDGWRALVYIDGSVRVRTRTGRDVTSSLPELAAAAEALGGRTAILDGELVVCHANAVNFYALSGRMAATGRSALRAAATTPVTFIAFDLMYLDGDDLTGWPLMQRKHLLDKMDLDGPWTVNRWYPGDGDALFAACVELHHEGVVAKRLDSPYRPGRRTRTWLKRKCPDWLEFDAPRRQPAGWLARG